jgi:hypothetical protein
VKIPRRLLGDADDAWPRVIVNTLRAATAEPRRELRQWGKKPRRTLDDTQANPVAWAILGPLALLIVGGQLTLGAYPGSFGYRLLGPPVIALGALGVYLDIVYIRRPVRRPPDPNTNSAAPRPSRTE